MFTLCFRLMLLSSQFYQELKVFITMLTRVFEHFHSFLIHLTLIIVGLSASMFVTYSIRLPQYQTFSNALISTVSLIMKDHLLVTVLTDDNPTAALAFYIIMVFVFILIVSNVFVALILHSFWDCQTQIVSEA